MKVGAIDVGTNSCRMLAIEYDDEIQEITREVIITRLGEGVDRTGKLASRAADRTLNAILYFVEELNELGVENISLVGTSALRDVSNPELLLDRVYNKTGLKLQVISGVEEAQLVYAGVSLDLEGDNFLVLDIGGGSTEFIWKTYNKEDSLNFISLNMGAVRLTERYISEISQSIPGHEREKIKKAARKMVKNELKSLSRPEKLIGVGGTITTLAAIDLELTDYRSDLVHKYRLTKDRISSLINKLAGLNLDERKKLKGLQPERADIITAGALILEVVMEEMKLNKVTVSEHGILYGIIADTIKL